MKAVSIIILAMLMIVSGIGTLTSEGAEPLPPTIDVITSSSPTNHSTSVAYNKAVQILFSATMRTNKGSVVITPTPLVTGAWSWSVNKLWYNYTGVQWNPSVKYYINLTSFQLTPASSGHSYQIDFTTAARPTVVAVVPADTSTTIGAFANYSIQFSLAMDTAYDSPVIAPTPTEAGSWAWSVNKLWYNYSGVWDVATIYTISLTSNFRSLDGFRLTGQLVYSFTTDLSILVVQTIPQEGSTSIPINRPFYIEFDDEMADVGTLTIEPAPAIAGSWVWSANKYWYNYTGVTWNVNVRYYLNLTGFYCHDWFALQGDTQFYFNTVEAGTTISYTSPSDGESDVGVNDDVVIQFNTAMNVSAGLISVEPTPTVPGSWAWSVDTLWYNYTSVTWAADEIYWVNLSAAFESFIENPIQGDTSKTFTTATPPIIDLLSPLNNAVNVLSQANYSIHFDDTMNTSFGIAIFTPQPAVNGSWAWSVDKTYYNYTGVTWSAGTLFTVTVDHFTCQHGFDLGGAQFYYFTTRAASVILSSTPGDESVGVEINQNYSLQYSATMKTDEGTATITPTPSVLGVWSWSVNKLWYNYTGVTWNYNTTYWINLTDFGCFCGFDSVNATRSFTSNATIPTSAPIIYGGGTTTENVIGIINVVEIDTLIYQFDYTGNPISYRWLFGDGGSSMEVSPVHEYTKRGTYTVSCEVTFYNGEIAYKEYELDTTLPLLDPETGTANIGNLSVPGGALFISAIFMMALVRTDNHIGADFLGRNGKNIMTLVYSLMLFAGGYLLLVTYFGV